MVRARGERADQPLGQTRKIMSALQRPRAVAVGIFMVEVVDEDQVEIGRRGHLAAAEPSHADDGGFLILDPAVLTRELIGDEAVDRADDAFGHVGKGDPGRLRRHRAGENARADQEQALLPEQPQAVEKLLIGIGVGQRDLQPLRYLLPARHRAEEARIDQSVHQPRLQRQHVAKPRSGADDRGDQRDEVRVLLQQAEQGAAALHGLQEVVELVERAVRIFRAREAGQDDRQHALQRLAGRLGAQCAVFADEPGFQRLCRRHRLLEAKFADVRKQPLVGRAAAKVERGSGGRRRPLILEQAAVVALNAAQMGRAALRRRRRDRQSP